MYFNRPIETSEPFFSKTAAFAFLVSLLFHLSLCVWVFKAPKPKERKQPEPTRIQFERIPYVEANPSVPEEVPKQAPFQASRNQKAAQKSLTEPDRSPLPENKAGQKLAHKIVQGSPERRASALQVQVPKVQSNTQAKPQKKVEEAKDKLGYVKPKPKPKPTQANKTNLAAKPEPRASRPALGARSKVSGPLIRTARATGRVGLLSVDARFSQFARYQERMLELIVARWHFLSRRSSLTSLDTASFARVRFVLHPDGKISALTLLQKTCTETGAERCLEAIRSQGSFGPWTEEMVRTLKDTQTFYIQFFYR